MPRANYSRLAHLAGSLAARTPLRALLTHHAVERHIVTVARSTVVGESWRFATRELVGTRSTHVYRIRESGLRVAVEHGTADAHALDQAFYQHAHEPPPAVRATLERLGRPLRALDAGAHIGCFGLWLHGRMPIDRIVAIEPDPRNAAHHRRQIDINGLANKWEVVEAAAVTTETTVSFTVGRATNGRVIDGDRAGASRVRGCDLFAMLDGIDLLKLDIEGGEWAILADPRARELQPPVVMLEYHAHDAPSPDPAADAVRALQQAGYETHETLQTEQGFGVIWASKRGCESA